MLVFASRHVRRRVLGAALLTAGLLANPLRSSAIHAAMACRADPLVTLSNGVTVQMSNTIYDDSAYVQQVVYTLHAPSGTWITNVAYPPGTTPGIRESVQFVADNDPGRYESYAVVYDANSDVVVSADTIVTDPRTNTRLSQTAQDRPGQDIKLDLRFAEPGSHD